MSYRALPLQFLNLGGEMMYIIDQRLRAQSISEDRAHKVRNDILAIMLSKCFVEELFHPQPLYSKVALRTVFNKLAHASIMKLNAPSMDKLFDLMLMSLKHQVVLVPQPRDLLVITLNHLDSMADFATAPDVYDQVQRARFYFLKAYSELRPYEWNDVRRDLLMFLQDLQIRVSVFLKTGIQDHFGTLLVPTHGPVPQGSEVPGNIRFFNPGGEISLVTLFPKGGDYACAINAAQCADPCADRHTTLGLNIYTRAAEVKEGAPPLIDYQGDNEQMAYQNFGPEDNDDKGDLEGDAASLQGQEELNLLAMLIGTTMTSECQSNKEFRLNLFPDDGPDKSDDRGPGTPDGSSGVITFDAETRQARPELHKIMQELHVDDVTASSSQQQQEDEDLFDLLEKE